MANQLWRFEKTAAFPKELWMFEIGVLLKERRVYWRFEDKDTGPSTVFEEYLEQKPTPTQYSAHMLSLRKHEIVESFLYSAIRLQTQ